MNSFYDEIIKIVGKDDVLQDELMSNHTSFRVGGKADYFITARNVDALISLISKCKEYNIKYYVVGNGTNLLVKDNGIRGAVIKIAIDDMSFDEKNNMLTVSAGMPLTIVSRKMASMGKKGFEYMSGIPGTIGGAVRMNAGSYGTEIKDILVETTYLDENCTIKKLSLEEHEFDYRTSIFEKKNWIVLESKFKLEDGNKEELIEIIEELASKRIASQPMDKPNAGSTFKRGDGFITAKLIDDAGLKGKKIGGAEISTKHAGFIVNSGDATADDIIKLIKYTKDIVKEKYNKEIVEEVIIIGD